MHYHLQKRDKSLPLQSTAYTTIVVYMVIQTSHGEWIADMLIDNMCQAECSV